MIFYISGDGGAKLVSASPVHQGSADTCRIGVIAPFADNMQVTCAFRLADGSTLAPALMTRSAKLDGIFAQATDSAVGYWEYDLPGAVSEKYGRTYVQFYFYSAEEGAVFASAETSFLVSRGVSAQLPETPDETLYGQILSAIAELSGDVFNGYYAARAIYAWNSEFTYGVNEITFYPDYGEYGAFVKSVTADNKGNAPYTDGVLDSAHWEEVTDFNALQELAGKVEDIETYVQQASDSAEAAGAAKTAAEAAQTAAETAKTAAETAQTAAETAATSAQDSAAAAEEAADRAQDIVDGVGGVYTPVGSVTYAQLPETPTESERGYVYNISDSFTTDDRFVEGAGRQYAAGTNVAVVLNGEQYMYDVLGGMVDLTNYAQIDGEYPGMSVGTATNATNAENAVKAEQDGDGNEISTTYAKQNGTYPGLTAGAAQRVARAGIINSGRQGWWRFLDVQYTGSTSADAALDEIFVVNGVLDDGEDKTLAAALLELRGVYSPQASEWTEYSLVYLGGDMPYTRFCVYTDTDGLHVSQNGNESELELLPVSSKSTGFTVSYGGGPSTPPESANAPEVLLPKLNESARVYYYKLLHFAGEIGDSYALEESNIDSGDNTLAVGDYVQDGSGMMLRLTGVNDGSGLATGILLGRYIPYYLKPPGGIPESDMAQDVQTSLSKADASLSYTQQTLTSEQQAQARTNIGAQAEGDYYVKPSGGIPETDLSAEVQAALEKANEALTELPVASVIQLGGVKPVGKDGDMTQNVGIDAQGRLYTYPAVTYVPVLFKSTYDLPDTVGSSVGLDDAFLTPTATNIKAGDLVYDTDGRIGRFTSDYDDSGINIAQTLYVSGEYATISDVNAKYTKPASGIPESDLSQSVQTLLDAADTAYQKPAGGIPKSDLAGDVQASLDKADSALQSAPVTSVAGKTGAVTLAKGDVGLSNVDNVKQYSASNPPPYPVTSVAGKTGAVALAKGDVGLGNVDNVQQYSASNPPPYPVTSVNGQTGAVSLSTADDVEILSGLAFEKEFNLASGNIVGYRIGKLVTLIVTFTPSDGGIAWRSWPLCTGIPIPRMEGSAPIPEYVGVCIPDTPCSLAADNNNNVQFNLRAYEGSSRLWIHRCTTTNGADVGTGVLFKGTITYICQ